MGDVDKTKSPNLLFTKRSIKFKAPAKTREEQFLNRIVSQDKIEYRHPTSKQLHRKYGPAKIEENGNESWYIDGSMHREDGPASIRRGGQEEWWVQWGNYHREDGPAILHYDEEGKLIKEEWFFRGRHHRADGPALINYENGFSQWWVDGQLIEKEISKKNMPKKKLIAF